MYPFIFIGSAYTKGRGLYKGVSQWASSYNLAYHVPKQTFKEVTNESSDKLESSNGKYRIKKRSWALVNYVKLGFLMP